MSSEVAGQGASELVSIAGHSGRRSIDNGFMETGKTMGCKLQKQKREREKGSKCH